MLNELKGILIEEGKALEEMLILLEEQHKLIRSKDVFGMEGMVEKLQLSSKRVAEWEVSRRRLVGNLKMSELIERYKDNELEEINRNLNKLLHAIELQKETNDLLIKQGLSFTNRVLAMINPRRETATYGAGGYMRR